MLSCQGKTYVMIALFLYKSFKLFINGWERMIFWRDTWEIGPNIEKFPVSESLSKEFSS